MNIEECNLQQGGRRGKRVAVTLEEEEEESEENFQFYIFSEAPTRSYIHKEESETVLLEEENFVPPEGHCSAISIDQNEMRVFVYGGHYPESTKKSNDIKIMKFKLENRVIFQEKSEKQKYSTQVFPSSRFWVIGQPTNCTWGSYLPPMSFSDMTFIENDLLIVFGHYSEYNKTSEDLFRIKNIRKEGIKKPEVIQIPGKETKSRLKTIPPGFKSQFGELPVGGRAGHRVFTINKEYVVLIGGHSLVKQEQTPFKQFTHPHHNLYLLNSRNYEWISLNLLDENEYLLKRSHFGACQDRNNLSCFYICGGVQKNDITLMLETLSAFNVLKLTITDKEARIEIISITSDVDNLLLSSFSLSFRNIILFISGGNTGKHSLDLKDSFVKNSNLIMIDPTMKTSSIITPPDIVKGIYFIWLIQIFKILYSRKV